MTDTKFTPGPWEWVRGLEPYSDQYTLSPGVLIADGSDGTPDGDAIDRANACLIAAAPDMYEALGKVAVPQWRADEYEQDPVRTLLKVITEMQRAAIAAIAKAEGTAA